MNDLQLFRYADDGSVHQVRTGAANGEPVWIGRDICEAVGVSKYRDALAQLDDDERVSVPVDTPGGQQMMTAVTESGLYSLLLISRSPKARPFRRWVTKEVLPTIRKTGGAYIAPGLQAELDLTDPDVALDKLIEVATIAKRERAKRIEAEAWARELEPAAAVTVFLADADGADLSFADAAKILCRHPGVEVGQRRLFDRLARWGWIYRPHNGAGWRAYQSQVDAGRLVERLSEPYQHRVRGWVMPDPQVRITIKGIQDILHRLTGNMGNDLPGGLVSR